MRSKKTIIVITLLIIASIFVVGVEWANETTHRLFHSYFADIAIPFGYYLLLITLEEKHKAVKKWYVKAFAVFILCATSETLQYFGIYALASVFDPVDYIMYAFGAILGAFFDKVIFKRLFSFWH